LGYRISIQVGRADAYGDLGDESGRRLTGLRHEPELAGVVIRSVGQGQVSRRLCAHYGTCGG
jgi:hypothetical protein